MDWTTIGGMALRHGATTAGGWLVAHGYLNSDGVSGFVGACAIFGGIFASWWQKQGHAAALAVEKSAADYWRNKKTGGGPGAHP
jgi:hypothetical protein